MSDSEKLSYVRIFGHQLSNDEIVLTFYFSVFEEKSEFIKLASKYNFFEDFLDKENLSDSNDIDLLKG